MVLDSYFCGLSSTVLDCHTFLHKIWALLQNYLLRAFSAIFDKFKILAKVSSPIVRFDKKQDGEVSASVWPIDLKLGPNFLEK